VIGPWLITSDLVDGGTLGSRSPSMASSASRRNTSDMVFNTKQLVSYISDYMTLKPGDLIFTGNARSVISR